MAKNTFYSPVPSLLSKEYIVDEIAQIDNLSVDESSASGVSVWDDIDAKIIPFHFLEDMSSKTLAERIFISKDIPVRYQVDKNVLADYLWDTCDRNGFITLEEFVVIWSEPDNPDTFEPFDFIDSESERLALKFGDEYGYEIGHGFLGQLWFERNIVVINMGEIVRTAAKIADENKDIYDEFFSLENQILIGFLTTAIHELRHLQLDTNVLLPMDFYPVSLNSEDAVEQYCRDTFENSDAEPNVFPNLYDSEKVFLDSKIQSASTRTVEHRFTPRGKTKGLAPEL